MNLFLPFAALLALVGLAFAVWPLLLGRAPVDGETPQHRLVFMPLLLSVVFAGSVAVFGWLYQPWANQDSAAVVQAVHSSGGAVSNDEAAELTRVVTMARQMQEHPDDAAGWLALGEAYERVGAVDFALRAFQRADRLGQGQNAEALADIGEALVLGNEQESAGQFSQAEDYLQRALVLAPDSSKALFYSAVAAQHLGKYDQARGYIQKMMQQPIPDRVRQVLQQQLAALDAQAHPQVDERSVIHVHVALAPTLRDRLQPGARLFIFAREGTAAAGPPLAVKRLDARLPVTVDLSSADAPMPSHSLAAGQHVHLLARISQSGDPLAHSGDLSGAVDATAGASQVRELVVDSIEK